LSVGPRDAILARFIGLAGFVLGPVWIALARGQGKGGRLLDVTPLRERLEPWIDAGLLKGTRVVVVPRVRLPGAGVARLFGQRLVEPGGLCLGRTVLIAEDVAASERLAAIVFHELVHAAQFRRMGTARFCTAYLAGWWAAGRSYFGIPLEREASALQERFQKGEVFRVADAIGRDQG
jgi:hypothetical protein